jgi:diguanylate cyclase (GGDEF)-like protein/PAS domain S-box-containing protein
MNAVFRCVFQLLDWRLLVLACLGGSLAFGASRRALSSGAFRYIWFASAGLAVAIGVGAMHSVVIGAASLESDSSRSLLSAVAFDQPRLAIAAAVATMMAITMGFAALLYDLRLSMRWPHVAPTKIDSTPLPERQLRARNMELEAALAQLKRQEESVQLLFASNPLPMWVYHMESLRFLAVNEAAIEHYGYSREQFLSKRIIDFRPPAEREETRRIVMAPDGAYQNGRISRHIKADGELIDVAIYARALEYQGVAASLVACIDITQTRRAEARILRMPEFLDTVIENVPTPILVKDARDFRHILVNRAAETFLGVSREHVLGRNAESVYASATAAYVAECDRFILQRRQELFCEEYRFETPGAGVRYVKLKGLPIFDEKAEPLYLLTVINDITERRLANERIAHLTSHDVFTDLPNRAAFGQKLANALALAGGQGVAALCVDIDRFKEINDEFGYAAADRVLETVARRLREAAGDVFLARVDGDEFSLIVIKGELPAAAVELADRLLDAVVDEIAVDGARVKVGLSIGVAVFPADGADAATLIANAEAALSRAKNEGRGVTRFFEADMDSRLRERRMLEHDLQSAVALRQMHIHYQPQTNIAGELCGFEALARWAHPTRGAVPPGVFIPLAEESGAIVEIGAWILKESCREAACWPRALGVAVNLSPIQLRQSDVFALVRNTLIETGLSGARLALEITEGVLIGEPASALSVLRRVKALGVRIAMDDFGAGYASLSYLQSFPFDKIKIDRSFVANVDQNVNSAAIIRAVLGLARGLHLPVVAEGVETEEQLAFLEREGCDEIQGYIMGRPRPIEDYAEWIASGGVPPRAAARPRSNREGIG